MGVIEYRRIGIGIGRPESREPNDVAKYVLGKMNQIEIKRIEGAAMEVKSLLESMAGSG